MSKHAELDKAYDPTTVEREVAAIWEQNGAFAAVPDDNDRRFVVMIPLPNVTGSLHLGHAINNTLQDIVTRWHRMRGFNSLYQPGTDHAGIATQAVVEKRILQDEGKSRHDLGREELVRRIWDWKADYEKRILGQLKEMGCSCDWDRVRFTLDDKYTDSVFETFYQWFSAGLVRRGKRLVNWDTFLQTAVADDEVYHETIKGSFWHFKYPLKDPIAGGPTHLGFATTRPETMLADVALAVNPEDERYKALIGKTALIPLFDPPREIPIIADAWADPKKGTGCVKITPAHDPNDYEVGLRNDLPMINVMTPEGRVNDEGGKYAGMTFPKARTAVVEAMESMELLDSIERMPVDLPCSDRSKTPIEPYLSDQWFVSMGDVENGIELGDKSKVSGLAQAAIDAVEDGRVKIFPERYKKTYIDWLAEKRDWCISRQLWWGHRIPVWYASEAVAKELVAGGNFDGIASRLKEFEDGDVCHRMYASSTDAFSGEHAEFFKAVVGYWCPRPGKMDEFAKFVEPLGFKRETDVLDTWFSSQLWPMATLGWPEETADLNFYYPGKVLITSRDIISLWVARMVLCGLYFRGQVPFEHVYIHPKILDGRGETMSKSKGNGVDPLDIISVYGADAMRYSLADMTTETQDVRMPVDYRCPHCQGLTQQTAQNMQAKRIKCKACEKEFATRWADDETAAELGRAQMVSDKFEIGRNFCNKLWNAARFAFMNIEGVGCERLDPKTLPTEDRWVLAQLSHTVRRFHTSLSSYHYSSSIKLLRDFFWDSVCDWYIELTKARMIGGEDASAAKQVLAFCLDQILRLLHPFMPYVTERLWGQLNAIAPDRGLPGLATPAMSELLVSAEFPPEQGWPALDDDDVVSVFGDLQAATRAIRDLKNRNGVAVRQEVDVTLIASPAKVDALRSQGSIVQRMASVKSLIVETDAPRPANSGTAVVGSLRVYVHGIGDDKKEVTRLEKEMAEVEKQISGKERKLGNDAFVKNAKPEVVEAERGRLAGLCEQREAIKTSLALLS
jgi:valyl-tRNA synthetase